MSKCIEMDEIFEIVDEDNNIIGTAARSECHGNPSLIHRTSHIIIIDGQSRILLQKRSLTKDIQPGKWDTAVGGHLMPGENFMEAALRELKEELGVMQDVVLKFLFDIKIRNEIESENTRVFILKHCGPFAFQKEEIDQIKFWDKKEIFNAFGKNIITPICEKELKIFFNKLPIKI